MKLLTVAEFNRQYPDLARSEPALRHKILNRKVNGALEAGAVVEVRPQGDKTIRVQIWLNVDRWIAWMVNPRKAIADFKAS